MTNQLRSLKVEFYDTDWQDEIYRNQYQLTIILVQELIYLNKYLLELLLDTLVMKVLLKQMIMKDTAIPIKMTPKVFR